MRHSIVLTGGGTGGHIMPNLALVPFLKPHFDQIHYIGSDNGTDAALVGQVSGIAFHSVPTVKLLRKLTLRNLAIPWELSRGKSLAIELLRNIRPAVVFSKGGFVSLPVVFAAQKLGIPYIIHESDSTMGLANKLCARRAVAVITAFPSATGNRPNAITLGAPLRREIYCGNKATLASLLDPAYPTLLVIGGSSGSLALNRLVEEALPQLTPHFNVLHLVGKSGTAKTAHHYHSFNFAHNIADFFASADLAISRGGANALFELIALGIPTLAIPLPKSGSSRGDQVLNVRTLAGAGYIHHADQHTLTADSLAQRIAELASVAPALRVACLAAPNIDATRRITELILRTIAE